MLKDVIESETGFQCEETDDAGHCVEVFAPRPFIDDPEVFLFIQYIGDRYLISDGAEVYLYHGHCNEAANEMAAIVRAAGLEFINAEIRLTCDLAGLRPAIDKFLCVMSALAAREQDFNRMWVRNWDEQHALVAK